MSEAGSAAIYKVNHMRFAAWFMGLSIGLPIGFAVIQRLTGYDLSSSAVSLIPMMISSMQEGVHFARTEKIKPQARRGWMIALHLAVFALVLSAVLMVMSWVMFPGVMGFVLNTLGIGGALSFLAGFFVLAVLLARLFLGLGARTELKQIASKAEREKE